jgi:hypothetical protein
VHPSTLQQERHLVFALSAMTLLAIIGHFVWPLTPERAQALLTALGLHAHVGGHVFADARAWLGLPNAMDVLSNLPFAAFGVWGLIQLPRAALSSQQRALLQLFFIGLLLTTAGSMAYHLAPSNATLLWDRAGMSAAFAGVLGLAASERVSNWAGQVAAVTTILAAALALWVWRSSGDVLPWSVVQFGGMALVISLACLRPRAGSMGISLLALMAFYGLAKGLESTDHAVFEATGQWLSGHSLKHVVASMAALPILLACRAAQSKVKNAVL